MSERALPGFGESWLKGTILLWVAVGALCSLCIVHGLSVQRDVPVPPDLDSLRDLGFIQALLDGNYWGDPSYAGEWRYYPPLVHAIIAVAARLVGVEDLALFWTRSGIWLNALTPIAFFLMCRTMLAGSPAAVVAIGVYVLWSGSVSTPWMMGGYTPWALTPSIAQTLFFLSVLVIIRTPPPSLERASLLRAALIGLLIGLTTLAHLVPGVILTAIVVSVTFLQGRWHPRAVVWLAVVAVTELVIAAPYLAVSVIYHSSGILNEVYTGYVEEALEPGNYKLPLLLNLPGGSALVVALVLAWRGRGIERASAAALFAWIAICLLFLMRHYACALPGIGTYRACHVFPLTVHHYHLYLQNAWACVIGYVVWGALQMAGEPGRVRWLGRAVAIVVLALLAIGVRSFLNRAYDQQARQDGMTDGWLIDLEAYRWIVTNTAPSDVFVTEIGSKWHAPAAFSAIAAGRQVVAVPALFSNPFVDWRTRDARRRTFLDAAAQEGGGDRALCALKDEHAYLLVPRSFEVRSPRARPVYASAYHAAYLISTERCG
jgi:hypothetical protein